MVLAFANSVRHMDTVTILLFLLALLCVATLVGLWWKGNQGRITRSSSQALPPDVPLDLIDPKAVLTLLQFSGPFCSYCSAMREILGRLEKNLDGISHREIDITDFAELTRKLRITQTPTTLLVTASGHIHARIRGAAKASSVTEEVTHALDYRKAHSDGYLI